MLLARVEPDTLTSSSPLRGVFKRGDAWIATGDLFRRDADGDHWLVDRLSGLVVTKHGRIPALPIAELLGDLQAVRLAVAYGVPAGGAEVAVASVRLRSGARLGPGEIAGAV